MKKIVTDNFGLKMLSLLIAFVVWIMIVNAIDPIKTTIIKDIPVTVINSEVIENLEQCYEIVSQKSVSITVKGNKSIVDKLKPADFVATADMELISVTCSVPVSVKLVKKVEPTPDIIVGETNTILVKLDKEVTNSYQVNLNLTGTGANEYYFSSDEVKLSVNKIKISGPQKIVDTVDKVRVDIDVSEITESSKARYEVRAYNSNGDRISSDRLKFSRDFVDVTINPLSMKTINIKTNIVGNVSSDYVYKGTECKVNRVKIAGESDVINNIGDITIDIDISNATGNITDTYNLQDYLPENVKIVSEIGKVDIVSSIDALKTKNIQFKASTLKFVNIPNDTITNYNTEEILTVTIKGEEKDIENVTIEKLAPHVDMQDLPMGVQNIKVLFEEIEGITIANYPIISVQLSDKDSIVEENILNPPNIIDSTQ